MPETDAKSDIVTESCATRPSSPKEPQDAEAAVATSAPSPRDWSTSRKVVTANVLAVWVLSMTYSSSAYAVSVREMSAHFHKSREYILAGVSVYVLAFAAGPLLYGPASDLYGRRPVYALAAVFYTGSAFGAAFAPSAASLIACRFLMGFFGSASINNVVASIADFTHPIERLPLSSIYALFTFGGPALGPLCGAFVQEYAGFRWNLRVMAIFAAITSFAVLFVPETHEPTLVAQHLRKEGQPAPPVTLRKALSAFRVALSRPLLFLFTEPILALVSAYLTFLYSILYGFFAAFEYVWVETRGFSLTSYGLTYASLGLGFLLGFVVLQIFGRRMVKQMARARQSGKPVHIVPESRLRLAVPSAILTPISLILFSWTAPFPHVHWIAPCIAEFLFGWSMFNSFTAFIPFLAEAYLPFAASALAAAMFARALVASVFPLFILQMYEAMTIQGATMLLAAVCLVLAPLPILFIKYGGRIRARSAIAVHDP